MKNLSRRKKNNIIIASLCAIVVLMGIGYAAFASQLRINGTSNISSNFNVLITDITSGSIVGSASNAAEPTHTDTTATFSTNLVSPGDSITYTIKVENKGTIDATLSSIEVNTGNNEAIEFETSGIKEGDNLLQGESDELYVKVTYSNSVTSQPENTSSTITVTLNYEQATGAVVPGGEVVDITDNVVTSGDGLYVDTYEPGRYVYKGTNPNNYIAFGESSDEYRVIYQGQDIRVSFSTEEECKSWLTETSAPSDVTCTLTKGYSGGLWRIISKEPDGTYKIVKNDLLPTMQAWDTSNSNNWNRPATLNTYLNGEYYTSLDNSINDYIVSHTWGIGAVEVNNDDLATQIESEQGAIWNGKIGLISHSDYLKANSDMENCGTDKTNYENYQTCRNLDWLYISGNVCWTISPYANYASDVWYVKGDGRLGSISAYYESGVRPAVYLTSDISLSGTGTSGNPYVITN